MFSTHGYKSSFDYHYICFCPKNKNQTKNNDLLLNFNWKYNLTLFYMQFYGSNLMCHQNKKPNIKKKPKTSQVLNMENANLTQWPGANLNKDNCFLCKDPGTSLQHVSQRASTALYIYMIASLKTKRIWTLQWKVPWRCTTGNSDSKNNGRQ